MTKQLDITWKYW